MPAAAGRNAELECYQYPSDNSVGLKSQQASSVLTGLTAVQGLKGTARNVQSFHLKQFAATFLFHPLHQGAKKHVRQWAAKHQRTVDRQSQSQSLGLVWAPYHFATRPCTL